MYETDPRIVLTLDAGGTNLVFSAIAGNREIVGPIHFHSEPEDLDRMLSTLVEGFEAVRRQLPGAPVAISFAFPGPADYAHGIIGDLPNFPSFRGGVALGPFLEQKFGIPVFINNDGNLFAYGEAISGALPEVNALLERSGSTKRYRNLLGVTFGTGFGAGAVIDGRLLTGDNGCGGDVWVFRNKHHEGMICEESVSIRAIRRVYGELTGADTVPLTPRDIFDIAEGTREGDRDAARESFRRFGEVAGDVIAGPHDHRRHRRVGGRPDRSGRILHARSARGDARRDRLLCRRPLPAATDADLRPRHTGGGRGVLAREIGAGSRSPLRKARPLPPRSPNPRRPFETRRQPGHRTGGLRLRHRGARPEAIGPGSNYARHRPTAAWTSSLTAARCVPPRPTPCPRSWENATL